MGPARTKPLANVLWQWRDLASEDRRLLAVGRLRQVGSEDAVGQQGHPGEGDHQPELVSGQHGPCGADCNQEESESVTHGLG